MSLPHQHRPQPRRKARPRKSRYLSEPQNASDVEAQMSQQARRKIRARLKMAKVFQRYRAQLVSNNYGVTVTSDPASAEEKICLTVYENKKIVPLTVKNSGVTTVYLTFRASELIKNIFSVRDCHGNIIKTVRQHTLRPGEAYNIKVHFHSHHAGFYEQLLVFKFKTCQESSDKFQIMRLLEVIRRTSFSEEVLPTSTDSLCNSQTLMWAPAKRSTMSRAIFVVPLKNYGMPDSIKDQRKTIMSLQRPLLWKNYSQKFHLLLHLEELHLRTEMKKYIQDNVPMFRHKRHPEIFVLQIAGGSVDLSVKLSGNLVLVTPLDQSGEHERKVYKGFVHHVDTEQIYLQFSEKFMSRFKEGMRISVNFTLNRLPLRMQHRAAALVYRHKLKEVLFPTGQPSFHHSHLYRLLDVTHSNPEQRKAIQHIVAASAKPAPYLVFGPPGTGKTVTLVEAIKQIVNTQGSCKILACAPSNSATDHLCEKILEGKIDSFRVFRMYALSFPVRNIPESLKSCSNLISETTLRIPSRMELMKYKVLVTTLLTAGRLVTMGIPPGHYTYIFVDEAGQAAETECIIPLAGLLKPQICQVVLAGDPKQLGPVITSKIAEKHGMGVSLLERLMQDMNLYKSHETYGFNNRFITKLLRNYRSHPAILKIPNELFYKGELQTHAHKEKCSLYCNWELLPKKGFPLIFHGVAGTDERDPNSPSVYNIAEVEVLKEYLKAFVDHFHKIGGTEIKPREIGIITPYRKQVEKIRSALQMDKELRKEKLENILVGSVEQFQGKEFNVILVSTVRSSPKLTAQQQRFTLGFVNDAKRFNVALTRAKALLVVVGDPRALKTDQIWNKFIHHCYKEGAYRGITVFDMEKEEDTVTNVHLPNFCGE